MPSSRQFLAEGTDPSGTFTVPESGVLLQMVRASAPAADIGYVILSDTAPDVVTYPELARFDWNETDTGVPTGRKFFWNGASWEEFKTIPVIADGTVTIAKLSPSGGASNQIIKLNSGGTAFVFSDLVTSFSDGGLPIAKISGTSGYPGVFVTDGSVVSWMTYESLWTAVFADGIPGGSNRNILYNNSGSLAWGAIDDVTPLNSISWNKLKFGTNTVPINSGAIVVDASLSGNHLVTLTANITSVTIENLSDGVPVQIMFLQDAVGGRTVSFAGSGINWVGTVAPVITATPAFADVISITQFAGNVVGTVAAQIDLS